MANIANVRIACDGTHFDGPVNNLDGRKITIWCGCDLLLELAVFHRGTLQDVSNLAAITVQIKPMGQNDTAPSAAVAPIISKTVTADAINSALTLSEWENSSKQHALVEFSGEEMAIAPGDAWLVIWASTIDEPEKIIILNAGRIAVRESSGGTATIPDGPIEKFYSSETCDLLFARREENLADLSSASEALANLGVGEYISNALLNEEDMESDSTTAAPTQHCVKVFVENAAESTLISSQEQADSALDNAKEYADEVCSTTLQSAENYADDVCETTLTSANSYANGAAAGALSAAKAYADNIVGSANSSAIDWWPANGFGRFSSYVLRPRFSSSGGICGPDGWMIFSENGNETAKNYFESSATHGIGRQGDLVFLRDMGTSGTATYYFNRPFSVEETAHLVGKNVTLSFDIKFGSGFPLGQEGHGLAFSVTGTSDSNSGVVITTSGVWSSSNEVIETFNEINEGSTTSYNRHNLTFTIPNNIVRLCIRIQHDPGDNADDYRFYLGPTTLAEGQNYAGYIFKRYGEDYIANARRFVKVYSSHYGLTESGKVYCCNCQFPFGMEEIPVCIRAVDVVAPYGFGAVNISNALQITTTGVTICRTATSGRTAGYWQACYYFACIPWTFNNPFSAY
jgi:hypothetical protein